MTYFPTTLGCFSRNRRRSGGHGALRQLLKQIFRAERKNEKAIYGRNRVGYNSGSVGHLYISISREERRRVLPRCWRCPSISRAAGCVGRSWAGAPSHYNYPDVLLESHYLEPASPAGDVPDPGHFARKKKCIHPEESIVFQTSRETSIIDMYGLPKETLEGKDLGALRQSVC